MSVENLRIALRDNMDMTVYKVDGKHGMPNVHYIGEGKYPTGWMLLLHIDEMGKRVATGLKREHINWMSDYIKSGGNAWVLVRVGRELNCLFWGTEAVLNTLFDRPTPKDFVELAAYHKRGNMKYYDWHEMQDVIMN
jgi:hypothetical protein